jgi:hypothetical protein
MKSTHTGKAPFQRFSEAFDWVKINQSDFVFVLKLVWFSIRSFFVERPGQIIGSALILLMVWGTHGNLELLGAVLPAWRGPGVDVGNRPQLIPGLPWDQELISFLGGTFLVVFIPILIIHFGFKQPLSDYGLGLPPKGRRVLALTTFFTLTLLSLPVFWIGAYYPSIRSIYPFFRSFSGPGQFILYESGYLPFFIAIEFIFRGYLLFGLARVRNDEVERQAGVPGPFYFGKYALLIQMLPYTAWHFGKPLPELWGALFWGLAAGATAYAVRSIWPVVLSHWLLNVFLDAVILLSS